MTMIFRTGYENKTEVEQYILNWIVTDILRFDRKPISVKIGDLLNPPGEMETSDGQKINPKWTWREIVRFYPDDIAYLMENLMEDLKTGVVE